MSACFSLLDYMICYSQDLEQGYEFGRRMYQVVRASQMSENIESKLVFWALFCV